MIAGKRFVDRRQDLRQAEAPEYEWAEYNLPPGFVRGTNDEHAVAPIGFAGDAQDGATQ